MKAPIVDAHLDMAMNVLAGRDYNADVADVRSAENRERAKCMVTLRELERGGVAIAFGTLFVGTRTYDDDGTPVYKTPPGEAAHKQLDVYLGWEADGKARIIRSRDDLNRHLEAWQDDGKLGVVVLIEGADSITSPDKLGEWFDAGVRVIGPAWSRTRYCGGTGNPGPLTAEGKELLNAMHELGVILDVSHMAEQSFWDSLDVDAHRVIATHANARSIVPRERPDRHLSDDMLRALGERDAVIGVVPANAFLDDDWEAGQETPLTLDSVKRHLDHMASIVGWDHVGIGSDLDGGFGVDETPAELMTAADIGKIGDVVPDDARDGVLGGNWLRVLASSLP